MQGYYPAITDSLSGVRLFLRRRYKLLTISTIVLIDLLWIALTDFTFDMASAAKVAFLVGCLGVVGWFYRFRRPNRRFEVLCVETAYLLAFSASAAVLSYLMTALDLPLIDDRLIAADAALGFDWMEYVVLFNENAWLGTLSSAVYVTTLSQVALTVIALGMAGKVQETSNFVSAVMLGGIVCILVSAVLPAAGALGALRPDVEFLISQPVVDLAYKQEFFDLRSGLQRRISLDRLHGLIAFPSYHCALSVLVVIAFRGFRVWFWPVALLNAMIVLSTPVDGGHHMVDALAGIAVAVMSWWVITAFPRARRGSSPRFQREPSGPPSRRYAGAG